jgi:hypothetical protein
VRFFSGVIALLAWTGLAAQFAALYEQHESAGEAAWIMLRFFTILTNLAIAVVMTTIAAGRPARPSLLAGLSLWILLVGIVYGLLLRNVAMGGHSPLANMLMHLATPVAVPIFWLAFAPKGRLRRRDPWLWAAFPLAYFAYAMVRGAIEQRYPYPFIDVAKIGWLHTSINSLAIAAAFVAAGYGLLRLDRRLAPRLD